MTVDALKITWQTITVDDLTYLLGHTDSLSFYGSVKLAGPGRWLAEVWSGVSGDHFMSREFGSFEDATVEAEKSMREAEGFYQLNYISPLPPTPNESANADTI